MSNRYKLGRFCQCGATIRDDNNSGKCKPCGMRASNQDPELRRRRSETISKLCRPGGPLHEQRRRSCAIARKARRTEEWKVRGVHAAAARERAREKMAWLPDDWRQTYRKMIHCGHYTAKQAKRIILEHIATEERRKVLAVVDANHYGREERDSIAAVTEAMTASARLRDAILGAAK